MQKIKDFNSFLNEKAINEFIDPVTLAFALTGIGIAFGSDIVNAYKNRKISKASLKELIKLKSKAEAKVKKYERIGDEYAAAEAQEEVDKIQAQIVSISRNYEKEEETIKDFERDKSTRSKFEDDLRSMDNEQLIQIIKKAKKDSSGI